MDPTIPLCQVQPSFQSSLTSKDRSIPWDLVGTDFIPPVYQLDRQFPPYQEKIQGITLNLNKTLKSLPPSWRPQSKFVDLTKYQNLTTIKQAYAAVKDFSKIRSLVNPYEQIGNSVFINRAAIKLANIDAIFNLTGHAGGLTKMRTVDTEGNEGIDQSANTQIKSEETNPFPDGKRFTFCDLAGAPGGFTEYLLYRKAFYTYGIGMSLKSGLGWATTRIDMERFRYTYGEDGSGDLLTQGFSFIKEANITFGIEGGAQLVVADGGFEVEGKEELQEILSIPLIIAESMIATQVLKSGGNFVVKIFDTVTQPMIELIYLLSYSFDRITIFKPMSSRPANSERYLICQGFIPETGRQVGQTLQRVYPLIQRGQIPTSLIKSTLPESCITYLRIMNNLSIDWQLEAGKRILQSSRKVQISIPVYDLSRALIIWNIPDNPDTRI